MGGPISGKTENVFGCFTHLRLVLGKKPFGGAPSRIFNKGCGGYVFSFKDPSISSFLNSPNKKGKHHCQRNGKVLVVYFRGEYGFEPIFKRPRLANQDVDKGPNFPSPWAFSKNMVHVLVERRARRIMFRMHSNSKVYIFIRGHPLPPDLL